MSKTQIQFVGFPPGVYRQERGAGIVERCRLETETGYSLPKKAFASGLIQ